MTNDDELLIMPNQIPPKCIKVAVNLFELGATPAEILAGVLNAWPGAMTARDVMEEAPHVILPLKESRT
jgi:hypothetical protein